MTVNVGVIGTGMIGAEHIASLAHRVAGAAVTAVTDVDSDRAHSLAAPIGAAVISSVEELVRRPDVDAVLIATPGFTHGEIVLDCLSIGKPILCEKPLATNAGDCLKVIEAEVAIGRRLVQVGFMRRFDAGYLEVKRAITAGLIGEPLMAHMYHRNPEVQPHFNDEMVVYDTLIHEMDITRWLFEEEVSWVSILAGKSTPKAHAGLHDPQVMVLETASGALVLAEAFVSSGFGYDVRCEILGSDGTVELTTPRLSRLIGPGSRSEVIHPTWRERFGDTYRLELEAWIGSVATATPVGPNAWDGYAATVIADAAVTAVGKAGRRVAIELVERPDLYAGDSWAGEETT